MVTLKWSATCFCENENGFGPNNGILCEGNNNSIYRKSECLSGQWCTGDTNLSSTIAHYMDLCENGELRNSNSQASNLNLQKLIVYKTKTLCTINYFSLQRLLVAVLSMIILQRPLDACCVKTLMKVTIASTMLRATATAGTTMVTINANRLVRIIIVFR